LKSKLQKNKRAESKLYNKSILIYGFGVNDANYKTQPKINGKIVICPYYQTWKDMIRRCYSSRFLANHPTYTECSVSDEWKSFMKFREWMALQSWIGKELDKDILIIGNKLYSKDTCKFVSRKANQVLCSADSARGELPIGVRPVNSGGKFTASAYQNNKPRYLGSFYTIKAASNAYSEAKRLYILQIACCEQDIEVKQGLYRHSERYRLA